MSENKKREKGRPPKQEGEHFVEIPLWGPRELHGQLTMLAEHRRVSRSALIRQAIVQALGPEFTALEQEHV